MNPKQIFSHHIRLTQSTLKKKEFHEERMKYIFKTLKNVKVLFWTPFYFVKNDFFQKHFKNWLTKSDAEILIFHFILEFCFCKKVFVTRTAFLAIKNLIFNSFLKLWKYYWLFCFYCNKRVHSLTHTLIFICMLYISHAQFVQIHIT